jgi:hypothetical protein
MKPEVFSSADGEHAQEGFQQWQTDNPTGFDINRKAVARRMLHRVGCGHVGNAGDWDPEFGDVDRRAKVCHKDRSALLSWVALDGVYVALCADCRP